MRTLPAHTQPKAGCAGPWEVACVLHRRSLVVSSGGSMFHGSDRYPQLCKLVRTTAHVYALPPCMAKESPVRPYRYRVEGAVRKALGLACSHLLR